MEMKAGRRVDGEGDRGNYDPMPVLLFLAISFIASVVSSICGIGGGVVIKPALDFFKLADVSTISFLSSCTVLAMSGYAVSRAMLSGDSHLRFATTAPLALGASLGGAAGQRLFHLVKAFFGSGDRVGAVQSICMTLLIAATLAYTLLKHRAKTHRLRNPAACFLIGIALGSISSFLGIGGGPIYLVFFFYLFSMETKAAAQNSLFVILISQTTNISTAFISHSVPAFEPAVLATMIAGGIAGGIVGRIVYKRIDRRAVERLFIALMVVIIGVSSFNIVQYARV